MTVNLGVLIGELRGEIRGVTQRLDDAAISRGRLHEKLDANAVQILEIRQRAQAVDVELQDIRDDIHAMKPEVEMVRNLRTKAAGAALVLGAIGALLWWIVGALWSRFSENVITFFRTLFPG